MKCVFVADDNNNPAFIRVTNEVAQKIVDTGHGSFCPKSKWKLHGRQRKLPVRILRILHKS